MTEKIIRTEGQYDRLIMDISVKHSSVSAVVLDNLFVLLREAVQEQYVDAQALYEEMYGWNASPEPFSVFLDHEFPLLADIPEWVFAQKVKDGS